MKTYATSARVEDQGQVRVDGVPFAPGTEVEVTISPKVPPGDGLKAVDDQTLAAVRARMQQLFQTVKGFRMSHKIAREELYERGSLR
jgi:hypothetical protein